MPTKLQTYSQLVQEAARQITGSRESWTAFLRTAARLYKYPYHDQLMIHAQRPDAAACAEYDFWNDRWGRYVRKGSRGIALIDTSGDYPRLRYVFDVSDTGTRANSREVRLWELREEHRDSVSAMLEREFDASGGNGLASQLEAAANKLTGAYWTEHAGDIRGILAGSFPEAYDEHSTEVAFKNAASVSIAYALMSRCGLQPEGHFAPDDFADVFSFSTPAAIGALGTAISESCEQVLRQIEATVKRYDREHITERSMENGRVDLHAERGLSDPRAERVRAGDEASGQVREDAESVSAGASAGTVERADPIGEAVSPPAGDRQNSEPEAGADDAGADEAERRDGEPESRRPDEVDANDEQPESPGGGNDPERADLQLSQGPEAEQLSLFPTEAEQIARIEEAESVTQTPFAFSVSEADIDSLLLLGSNTDNARLRIAAEFSKDKSLAEKAAFLRQIYHGGYGLNADSGKLAAWYTEDGIHLSQGSSARYQTNVQIIPWEDTASRIDTMLSEGRFATNVELIEAVGFEREQLAQSLWYLYRDLSEEAHSRGYLSPMETIRGGGFPDETRRLADSLQDPAFRTALTDAFEQFRTDYAADRDLLRFHYHKTDAMMTSLLELALPRREYKSEMAEIPAISGFITEDEITVALSSGSNIEGGKGRIYAYFSEEHTTKELADFLKEEYGTGGRSHAVSGASHSEEDHSGRGISLRKANCTEVQLSWTDAAKRILDLIRQDRFLTPSEREALEARSGIDARTEEAAPERRIEESDIEDALRAWNGRLESKQAVVRYMEDHARERGTAAWLSAEYGGKSDTPLHISIAGTDLEMTLSWPQVQRRLAQMIREDRFFTEEEKRQISQQEAAEWLAVEQAKLPPLEYAVGDHFIVFGEDGNSTSEFVLNQITNNEVFYTFTDGTNDEPVSIDREEFDRNLRSGHIREVQPEPVLDETREELPYSVGDTVYLEDGKPFIIEDIGLFDVHLRDPSMTYPILRAESRESFSRLLERYPQNREPAYTTETVAEYPAEENGLPYDIEIQTIRTTEPDPPAQNFRITDDHLGEGGPKAKFRANMDAINLLKELEFDGRQATPEEQEILSRYVGWGGLADAFDETKANWVDEFAELYVSLTPEEYAAARASTLNAHYTSPTVIRAIYEAVSNMGFTTGNILEPSMGIGNFFGMLPQEMSASRLYGVELDSITGRIAKQLYPNADITVAGFETTDRKDFFDLAVGNVPFGNYQVNDRAYNKLGFSIHNYFFAKTLDQVRPGGVIAFVTSRYTMDAKDPSARKYIAQRAELLGAIRLPNNAFRANAGTDVVSDILFLQKRDRPIDVEPDWVHL